MHLQTNPVRVKICGITNIEDARVAIDAGADILGFIFYPPSPRYITPAQAAALIAEVRQLSPNIQTAGVFVNEPVATVCSVMASAGLDLVQLHGKESPEMLQALRPHSYKSLQPSDLDTAHTLMAHYRSAVNDANRLDTPAFIADAPPAQLPGGNGMLADWSVARALSVEFPILLAGGLNPANVAAAIAAVQPWGVDVSSGVERAPGLKDHARVRAFIQNAKQGISTQ